MINELRTLISLVIIIFSVVMFFAHDPYFDSWKQCLIINGNPLTDTYTDHPYINGECCQYELIDGKIECL